VSLHVCIWLMHRLSSEVPVRLRQHFPHESLPDPLSHRATGVLVGWIPEPNREHPRDRLPPYGKPAPHHTFQPSRYVVRRRFMPLWNCLITGAQPNGSYTWRRIDAAQPRGVLPLDKTLEGANTGRQTMVRSTRSSNRLVPISPWTRSR